MDTSEVIQTWLREELPRSTLLPDKVQAECFGVTANARDLAAILADIGEGMAPRGEPAEVGAVVLVRRLRRTLLVDG